jgi:hypothetical protein
MSAQPHLNFRVRTSNLGKPKTNSFGSAKSPSSKFAQKIL